MHSENGFFKITAAKFPISWPDKFELSSLERELNELFFDDEAKISRYESEQIKVGPGDWVVDIYGGIPIFTSYALSKGASVLAVDPNRELCHGLCYSFHSEIVDSRVKVLHGSLGQKNRNRFIAPISAWLTDRAHKELPVTWGSGEVPIYSLDELVLKGFIDGVRFIRCNSIDLFSKLLPGARTVLQELKPRISIRASKAEDFSIVMGLLNQEGLSFKFERIDYENFSVILSRD